ncbi:baseplate J/gp47 family protein [Kaustia mangrovi]|uniref:Baseplate J/gp47 family protein n=1 Tax=Kaustia mangrovi TaxID=2593653 RepID=A0A7S8C5Y2_9HYPH|nr:baseplate J/gp47 family protein [Kaustia mangrovi]QPC44013.1 baseplate J/gp47 family protein [Kaustia mangrovi]
MAWQRPTLAELIDRISSDFTSRLALSGAVLRRSTIHVFSRVVAGAAHMLHAHLEFLSRQIFPDQSEAEYLERQATLFGLTRRGATFAAGDVEVTGANGVVIPAGAELQRADGTRYETDADATVVDGSATLAVTAVVAGENGNADAGVSLTFVSPVSGVGATAAVATGAIIDGVDEEDDDSLRGRLLERMRMPPHGGAEHDYIAWAKEIAGVTRVWVFPLEMGAGTVTVRFVLDDDANSIFPDGAKVQEVYDHIEAERPVTAEVYVEAPTPAPLDFQIRVEPATAAVQEAVEAELRDMLRREAEPGGTILISHIREAISIAAGEYDHTLVSPAADVEHGTGEMAEFGSITWV